MNSPMIDELRKFLASEKGEAFKERMKKKSQRLQTRHKHIEAYLETVDFKTLLDTLIAEHTDEYADRCYKKGYEPKLTPKMEALFGYIIKKCEYISVKEIEEEIGFPTSVRLFKGHYFTVTHGQGCFHRIYDTNFNTLFHW